MKARDYRNGRSDEGSALILVLVLMVVGSLIVLPLMDFAMSVGRANTVLTVKTARTEAVKAGLRIALADTAALYKKCGPPFGQAHVGIDLPMSGLAVPVKTECFLIDQAVSLATTEVRYGLAAVQVDKTVPAGMLSSGYVPAAVPPTTSEWIAATSLLSVTDMIWLPNLPTHGLSPRTPVGWPMPPEFATPEYPTCTVYFPGTYPNAVTLTGPTYFASGIYYFEDTVLIKGGADVVVGGGLVEGCVSDQYAAFYATGAPSTHNINGLGATFVLGKAGRLVVANDSGPAIKVRFNKRYVPSGDPGVAPSAGVSILSVNGKLGAVTGEDLLIPNVLEVPVSKVGALSEPATPQKYLPSTLVPPSVPDPPTSPIATGYLNSVEVSWTPPAVNGGSEILDYTVRIASGMSNGPTCKTLSNTRCVVTGLLLPGPYTFTVEARNASGTSTPSVESAPALTGINPEPAWSEGSPLPPLPPQLPIIDFTLTGPTAVDINVSGYVSIPQGQFRLLNPSGFPVTVNGGVVAASFDVSDPRVPIAVGLEILATQGTFRIVTNTVSGSPRVVSTAIVQINEGGPYEINSWEVQAD